MTSAVRVLITGGNGQLGTSLRSLHWPSHIELLCPDRSQLDLTNIQAVQSYLDNARVNGIINCAAWTAVDDAEDNIASAYQLNAIVPAVLAQHCAAHGLPMVQISTDYVFDGLSDTPYDENAPTIPRNVYGASKLAGEHATLLGNRRSIVLRTSWIVSPYRNNFLKTMLALSKKRDVIRVVGDQFGSPTSALDIAEAVRKILVRMLNDPTAPVGIYHFTNSGRASWAEFASEVVHASTWHQDMPIRIEAIPSSDYPTKAVRPQNSQLCTDKISVDYDIHPRPWKDAILTIVKSLEA